MDEGSAASGLGDRGQIPANQASGPPGKEGGLTTVFADVTRDKDVVNEGATAAAPIAAAAAPATGTAVTATTAAAAPEPAIPGKEDGLTTVFADVTRDKDVNEGATAAAPTAAAAAPATRTAVTAAAAPEPTIPGKEKGLTTVFADETHDKDVVNEGATAAAPTAAAAAPATGTAVTATTAAAAPEPTLPDSAYKSANADNAPGGSDFVPVLISGKADPSSIPTDLLQRLREYGSPLKLTEVFVDGEDAASANAGHGVIRQAESVLTNPHCCNIMLHGKCITYTNEDEDKAAEIFPAKDSWGVILVQVGVARDEEDPEYMRKFRSVRLLLSDCGDLGLTKEVWTRFFADLNAAYDECYEEYLKAKFSVPDNPAQLILSFEVKVEIPDGVISHNRNADIEVAKKKITEAIADPWSTLRESLFRKYNVKNIETIYGEKYGLFNVLVVPSTSKEARDIGNDAINGAFATVIERNVVLPYPGIRWKLGTKFDMEKWGPVCDHLERNAQEVRQDDEDEEDEEDENTDQGIGEELSSVQYSEDSRPVQEQSLPLLEPAEAAIVPPANAGPQAPPVAPQNREVLLKTIRKLYFTLIESDKHNWFDWLNLIRKHMNVLDLNELVKLRNREGETVLHVIVQYLKVDHLQVLFYLGVLPKLKDVPVEQNCNSQFAGYIARGITERYASKARGVRFLESLDRFVSWERSMTALTKSCRSGTESEVKFILQRQNDELHVKDEQGCNALYWACAGGNETIVKLLINKGVDVPHVNKRGESILYAACKLGHSHLIPLLFSECKLDPLQKDEKQKTILEHIVENGDITTLDKLRSCNYTIPDFLLPIAAYHCHLHLVEFLLDTCKVDLYFHDETNKTALLRAADAGSRQLVNYFISKGANIVDQDRRKRNVLHFLTEHKSNDAMKDVIDKAKAKNLLHDMINVQDMYNGGDLCFLLKYKDSGRRAWHCIEVKRWMVDLFMKKTKRGLVDVQVFGTAIVSGWGMAPRRQDIDQMESVFDQRKRSGQQPLDSTPLHYAAYLENVPTVKMLLAEGANPNIKDSFGETTMHMACMRGNLEMARLLEDAGAKLDIKDKQGQSPADVAELNENTQLVNYTRGKEVIDRIERFHKEATDDRARMTSGATLQQATSALRDMDIAIHHTLMDLGSGPVQEESSQVLPVTPLVPFSSLSSMGEASSASVLAFHTSLNPAIARAAENQMKQRSMLVPSQTPSQSSAANNPSMHDSQPEGQGSLSSENPIEPRSTPASSQTSSQDSSASNPIVHDSQPEGQGDLLLPSPEEGQ